MQLIFAWLDCASLFTVRPAPARTTGREMPAERDAASAAAAALCVAEGANIVRVHNVAAARDAVRVADAFRRFKE